MNVAAPPLHDLFIRRAVGLAFDRKSALAAVRASDLGSTGWYNTGISVVHIAPDDLEDDRLIYVRPIPR